MLPLDVIKIAYPTELTKGDFIARLEYAPFPLIIGQVRDEPAMVYLKNPPQVDRITDNGGAAVVVSGCRFLIDPVSMQSFNSVENRYGVLVVHKGKTMICAQGAQGFGYVNVDIGEADADNGDEAHCFTSWKIVADNGDETITLLERNTEGFF